jgi:hypothetical protein
MSLEHITIRAFRAPDDKVACARYLMEFIRVLEGIGVSSVFKPDVSWCTDRDSIVFIAEHPVHGMVGGIRLQRAKTGSPLPMESSLKSLAPGLPSVLEPLIMKGNAELGALWNAHRFAGRGVPHLLISAAVATANQLGLRSMCCLVAEYVAPYCVLNGFKPIEEVGDKGKFAFPVPAIHSYAMVIPDVFEVGEADAVERKRLMSLRMRPEQTRLECPKKETIKVTYELLIDGGNDNYREIAEYLQRIAA